MQDTHLNYACAGKHSINVTNKNQYFHLNFCKHIVCDHLVLSFLKTTQKNTSVDSQSMQI